MSEPRSLFHPTSGSPVLPAASGGVPAAKSNPGSDTEPAPALEAGVEHVQTLHGDLVAVRVQTIGWRSPTQLLWMLPVFVLCLGAGLWANAQLIEWRIAHRAAAESADRLARLAPRIDRLPPASLLEAAQGWWTTVRSWPDADRPAIVRTTGVALTRRFDALLRSTAQITPLQEVSMVAAWDSLSAETGSEGPLGPRREAARMAALARGSEAVVALARLGASASELREADVLAAQLVSIAPVAERATWERAHLAVQDRLRRTLTARGPDVPLDTQRLGAVLADGATPSRELRAAFVARTQTAVVTPQGAIRALRMAGPAGTQLQVVGRAPSLALLQAIVENATLRTRLAALGFESLAAIGTDAPLARALSTGATVRVLPVLR